MRKPEPGSIVNPAKLPPRARDSVCEQCHLEGETRVLHPGKEWSDFQAGLELESTFTTYLRGGAPSDGSLRAVSQSEQLAASKRSRLSAGKLWCGTCHDPHQAAKDRPREVRKVCLSCPAALFTAKRHQPADECVSCHMPRLRPTNVAHSSITDHRIPRGKSVAAPGPDTWKLQAWRQPDPLLAQRDLGVAYFEFGASQNNGDELVQAYQLLSSLPVSARSSDAQVLADLASMLLQQKEVDVALRLFNQAIALAPGNARYAYSNALALELKGDQAVAIEELRRSIRLDPAAPEAYQRLAQIYERSGQPALKDATLREYLRFMPQNLRFRGAKSF